MQLCLGTAQLGLAYGINNTTGMPSDYSAMAILAIAKRSGFTMLDTSFQYGVAQKRIESFMRDNPGAFIVMQRYMPGYVSVYTPEEAWEMTKSKWIQCPANILDGRMDAMIPRLQARGQTVFVRSLLLQGLLASDGEPRGDCWEHLPQIKGYMDKLRSLAKSSGIGVIEMCIRWVWTLMPDVAIVGCETPLQVEQVGNYWQRGGLPAFVVSRLVEIRQGIPEQFISPRMWGQRFNFTEDMR